jgi:hypothetical protein
MGGGPSFSYQGDPQLNLEASLQWHRRNFVSQAAVVLQRMAASISSTRHAAWDNASEMSSASIEG